MIYKPISERDIITVTDTSTASKFFNATTASVSSLTEFTLTGSPSIIPSSKSKIYNAYKETTTLSGISASVFNHVVNFFYGQNPSLNFNPNLNFSDTFFPRRASLSSLTALTILTVDRGQIGSRIGTSSINLSVNGTIIRDGNKQLYNGMYRGALYVGSTGVGDIFYDYGIMVLYGNYTSGSAFSDGRTSTFQLNNSTTSYSISSLSYRYEKDVIKKRIFVRLFNYEFNYTNNPTALKSNGTYLDKILDEPYTYITEIVLHSVNNGVIEDVAIAKLSTPVKKDFNTEKVFQFDIEPTF